jgi:hypothetical protein
MRRWQWVNFICLSLGMIFLYSTVKQINLSWDVSQNQAKQLSPEIQTLLRHMSEEKQSPEQGIFIYAFSSRTSKFHLQKNAYTKRFLEMIDRLGFSNVHTQFVDFDQERTTAERLFVKEYGKWVVQFGARRMELSEHQIYRNTQDDVEFIGMSNLSKTLRLLSQKRQYTIGFVVGHGEESVSNTSIEGLSDWGQELEKNGFILRDIRSVTNTDFSEVDIVVVAAPKQSISEVESQILYDHFDMGGKILYFDDVGLPEPRFFEYVGMQKIKGIATDMDSLFPYWDRPIVHLQPHPITRSFLEQRFQIVFSQATSVQISKTSHVAKTLLSLSSAGWMERGGDLVSGQAQFDKNIDLRGKAILGQLFEHGSGGKVMWFGDMDFLRNGFVSDFPLHASFLQKTLLYLVEDETDTVSYQHVTNMETLRMTHEEFFVFRLLALGFLPSIVAVFGLFQHLRRRQV